jgi:hypothetical protein
MTDGKPKGLFSKLIDGELQAQNCKRWPSDGVGGVVVIIPSCTGSFSTTSVPLTRVGPIPADHIEPGKTLTHGEQEARNRAKALATLARFTSNPAAS